MPPKDGYKSVKRQSKNIKMTNEDLERLAKTLNGKEVIVLNTQDEQGLEFALAHIIRTYAKKVYCVDPNYKMTNEPEGFRIIEDGKVVLIKGDLRYDDEKVYNIFKKLDANIDYAIRIIHTQ
jgi:5S rRNA maturation endonuclease (ribonuclease M5)